MSNKKSFLLPEAVENTIETMTTSSSFEDILNDALVYADQYVEAKYSEGEIDNWKDEMSSFRNSLPKNPIWIPKQFRWIGILIWSSRQRLHLVT